MDKSPIELLREGLLKLGVEGGPTDAPERLWAYATELLRWNDKVNLTAITRPAEVVEKHLLDSLAVVEEVRGAATLLDLGAGAGLPGIPLAVWLPDLRATLVDAVSKKVAFMKSGAVKAGVAGRVRAEHVRAEGARDKERLPQAELVISRAFMDVGPFLALAARYVAPGGRVVVMLGQAPSEDELRRLGERAGLTFVSRRTFVLPFSGDPRGVAVFRA